jgi:hypothetical protein
MKVPENGESLWKALILTDEEWDLLADICMDFCNGICRESPEHDTLAEALIMSANYV